MKDDVIFDWEKDDDVIMREQGKATNNDAIIAIDESGYGHMIVMLTTDEKKVRLQSEYDVLPDIWYPKTVPGLYIANMKIKPIDDDGDVDIDWNIVEPLYIITFK